MSSKEIIISINEDGTSEINMVGWEGKECASSDIVKAIIAAIGKETKVTKKQEYYKDNEVRIRQTW